MPKKVKQYRFSEIDWSLLVDIVAKHRPQMMPSLANLRDGGLSGEQREKLRGAVDDELSAEGLNSDSEPNQYGDQLEDLIDLLGHV